jgi:hypothetical protein
MHVLLVPKGCQYVTIPVCCSVTNFSQIYHLDLAG